MRLLPAWFIALFLAVGISTCGGCGMPSLLIKPVSNTGDLEEVEVEPGKGWSPSTVAIIEVEGMLINARSDGLLGPGENKLSLFAQQLEHAKRDADVKAVVLRINSPGGSVTCSDTMYEMVQRFRAETRKPVVANTQEVAASGAYYVACACDRIIAHPTSVVGSIGVLFQTFEISGAMNKLGITETAIKSAPLKDMGSPFKPLDPRAKEVMQGIVDEYYARFVSVVTTNRGIKDVEQFKREVADGRVFSGERAQQLGLVDRTGLLPDALKLAREMSGSPNARAVMYKRPYGYSGSIYASSPTSPPRDNVLRLELPETAMSLPRGFYYLWQP